MIKTWKHWITIVLLFASCSHSHAQSNSTESEVYLTFQYRGIVSEYVTAYYKNGEFYLPVAELFTVLNINHSVEQGSLSISGVYLGEKEYTIDFKEPGARIGSTTVPLRAEEVLIKDIDYFLKADIFNQLFGMNFSVNFNSLSLALDTDDKMPVLERYEREQMRNQISRNSTIYDKTHYPLLYDRSFSVLNGGFMDYNLTAIRTSQSNLFSMSNTVGAEILGGDLQGSAFSVFSDDHSSFTTSNLRWRYVQRNNSYFSSFTGGQTNSEGISNRNITGVKLSNKPVEPRLLFDRYVIDGTVAPESEVELYLNNSLIDYQQTDQSGDYRFIVPLTYGSTNYSVRIYTPSGQALERNTQIQLPFNYIPPGEVDYTVSAGQLNNPIPGSVERGFMGEATVAVGLTRWLTAKTSAEYINNYHTTLPSFTGSLSARLFSNYLVNADISSENFYRLSSSVVYPSGASWSLTYDYNPGESRLYNIGGNNHQARVNLFTPFRLGNLPLNIRWSTTYQERNLSQLLRYRVDLNTRLSRLNIRLGYQDQQAGIFDFVYTSAARLTNSYTYNFGRGPEVPTLLKGTFLRSQVSYLPGFKQLEEMEVQLSKDVLHTGRFQLSYGHNFIGRFSSVNLNFTVDFNKIRSNTTSRKTGSSYSLSQNFRGSLGYNADDRQWLLNNRQQVGQAGAAVRLFIDNNNDGAYQQDVDSIIKDPVIRLGRAGGRTTQVNGINYITQLLPYHRYDLQINKSALTNPLLVPEIDNFSIVTDPNQYKIIDIPFYMSGVVSGNVERLSSDSTRQGLGGVRLYLESSNQTDQDDKYFNEELRTFSDGSFYTYEVPPGIYNLYIDPNQLHFLDAVSNPDTVQVEVRALSQGDFIEDLNFTLLSNKDAAKAEPLISQIDTATSESASGTSSIYQIQLGSLPNESAGLEMASRAASQFGLQFHVVYNTATDLYAVRSEVFDERKQTIETIMALHKSGFENAALVVVNTAPTHKTRQEVLSRVIQIGAFRSKSRALKFASHSAAQLNGKMGVYYSEDRGLHVVYLSMAADSSDQQVRDTLSRVRRIPDFRKAFVTSVSIKESNDLEFNLRKNRPMNFTYQVQIEGVSKESEQAFLSSVLDETDTTLDRPQTDLIIFDNLGSWTEAQEIRKKLSRISSLGRPIVVLIEDMTHF